MGDVYMGTPEGWQHIGTTAGEPAITFTPEPWASHAERIAEVIAAWRGIHDASATFTIKLHPQTTRALARFYSALRAWRRGHRTAPLCINGAEYHRRHRARRRRR